MLIGEAARRAGVSRDTVRLYTRLGLVACTSRLAGSRAYADYDEDAVELIKNIKVAQSIGFSLSELVPIAAAYVRRAARRRQAAALAGSQARPARRKTTQAQADDRIPAVKTQRPATGHPAPHRLPQTVLTMTPIPASQTPAPQITLSDRG